MKHSDFTIGQEFLCGEKRWRCTDKGTRTIVAICLNDHPDDPSWFNGSDVHVMLALYGDFHQVVVTDEHFDGTDMIDQFLGERQRLAHQP